MSVFAILYEPASYTVDRNHAVYDNMGVDYGYLYSDSEARSESKQQTDALMSLSWLQRVKRLNSILHHYDVVIVNGYNHEVFRWLFFLNTIYKRTIGIDSDTPLSAPKTLLKRMVKDMYLHIIFSNRHVYGLAGGSDSHKELFRYYGMAEDRIFLMPMMVDNSRFFATEEKQARPFVFLYVGRIVACKNLEVMLNAFIQAFGNREDVELHIVGGGDREEYLQGKYVQNNIKFLGRRFGNELVSAYHSSHVLILPSSYEPWGLVVNEAMAAGLPVIVSDQVGAAHDLVEGHETGFIFHFDDVEELARRMITLREDEALYKRFADNAFHRMHDEWNYDFYTTCLKSFLDHVAQK